jgi:hypothetical protein
MIIHDLIRLGKAASSVEQDPRDTIEMVTSLQDAVGGFYRHVFIVEIARDGGRSVVCGHPYADWSEIRSRGTREYYAPQMERACAAPFIIPSGGNPRNPQGMYSVSAYMVYEKDFLAFPNNPEKIVSFLLARARRTVNLTISTEELEQAAEELSKAFAGCGTSAKDKYMGVILLCDCTEGGLFEYGSKTESGPSRVPIAESRIYPDKWILARLDRYIPLLWQAKFAEGAESGITKSPRGVCSFCAKKGTVVSTYCKAWPWMTTTWEGPLPQFLGSKHLVKAIAACEDCYKYLTYGANLVTSGMVIMHNWLVNEVFSPVSSASVQNRKSEQIFGISYVLPLLDEQLADPETVEEFVDAHKSLRDTERGAALHLGRLIGLEYALPLELMEDDYRLTILYFSGDPSRSDIHLRASIEDVMPSVASELYDILEDVQRYAVGLMIALNPEASERQLAWMRIRYTSLPYLLARAFGSGLVWQTLAAALHRQPITDGSLVSSSLARINELSRQLPSTLWDIRQEIVFYLAFRYFLDLYTKRVLVKEEEKEMRDWQVLQDYVSEAPIEELKFENIEELGFACGQLVGDYSRYYWHATKVGDGEGKDFLKTRVMTFGSSLTPETIIERALLRFHDYAVRVSMPLGAIHDLLARTGVVLTQYTAMKQEVRTESQRFMLGFWSGYSLSGIRKRRQQDSGVA